MEIVLYDLGKDNKKWCVYGDVLLYAWDANPENPSNKNSIHLHNLSSVSYTHLDVYKRQIHNWVRSMDNPVISPEKKSWDADAVYKPTVVLNKQKNKLLMWYNGRKQNCERIGLAEYRIK